MQNRINLLLYLFLIPFLFLGINCGLSENGQTGKRKVVVGAEQMNELLPLIRNKVIAVVANQTSMVGNQHLIDTLLKNSIHIKTVFAPEHGFRGQAEAGADVASGIDNITGLTVISLYGNHTKPTKEELKGIEMIVFDIQDVGVRFYTYISTLQYVMEACAENKIPLLILDRPNPNGYYVDGPVLDPKFSSFVGMNPIPIVHGLTMAEYALMMNGEGWLKDHLKCDLIYIKTKYWDHNQYYDLPIPPSPNLPNMTSVYLYPSLCLFEGTFVSVGRGTDFPFQVIGYPGMKDTPFTFTPHSIPGKSNKPLYEGRTCSGYDLREFGDQYINNTKQLYLFWIIESYNKAEDKAVFFNKFFDKLAGSDLLRQQIINGTSEDSIRLSWKEGLQDYMLKRSKYILYKDFE